MCDKFDDHISYMTAKHVDKNGDKLVSVAMWLVCRTYDSHITATKW